MVALSGLRGVLLDDRRRLNLQQGELTGEPGQRLSIGMTSPPSTKPSTLLSLALIVLLLGGGGGVAWILYAMREDPPKKDAAPPVPVVDFVVVRQEDIVERFFGYGSVRADRAVRVASEIASTVVELVDEVEAGSVVLTGQPILRLDDREYRHLLDRAQALADADHAALEELIAEATSLKSLLATSEQELRVTQDEKRRVADLFEKGQAAKKEFDFANLAYQQARRVKQGYEMELARNGPRRLRLEASIRANEASAALAELNVQRCEIRAPIAGTIDELSVDVGAPAVPGSFLFSIVDPTAVEVPIQVPAAVYDRVRIGAACRLASESMPGVTWQGRVARVGVKADQSSRMFSVFVDVDNREQAIPLIPGAFVRAEVEGPTYADGLLVPRGAIRNGGLLVARDQVVARREVSIKRLIGEQALVEGDLKSGEYVILSHLDRLAPGATVRFLEQEKTSLPPSPLVGLRTGGTP